MDADRPLRPWLASLLSFTGGPVGHLYAGAFRRMIGISVLGLVAVVVAIYALLAVSNTRIGVATMAAILIGYPVIVAVDAYRTAAKSRHAERHWYQRWWMLVVAIAGFQIWNTMIAVSIRKCAAESFWVPTGGMSATIMPGDYIMTNKIRYWWRGAKHADVVVFLTDGPGSAYFVQRIIGLPGDSVEVRDESVYLNGVQLEEPYSQLDDNEALHPELTDDAPVRIPPGHAYLLGDNRRASYDSRMRGPVPIADIIGLAHVIYWSYEMSDVDPLTPDEVTMGRIRWQRIGRPIE